MSINCSGTAFNQSFPSIRAPLDNYPFPRQTLHPVRFYLYLRFVNAYTLLSVIFSSFIVFFVCDMFCCQLSVVFFWTIIFQKISAYYLLFSVVFLRAKLFCYRSICHVNAPTKKLLVICCFKLHLKK